MRISGVVESSTVDGIGLRYVIFTQGCKHRCNGCQNPQTWNFDEGKEVSVEELIKDIEDKSFTKEVTISGGDPLDQEVEVTEICELLKKKGYNIWLYTGYSFEDIQYKHIMNFVDVIVDGEFKDCEKSFELKFKGSRNQRIIDVRKSLLRGEVVEILF